MSSLFDAAELDAAARLIGRTVAPTPLLRWPLLEQAVGTTVWVKHENHTPIGAFKVRGGLVHLDNLTRSGNTGAGVISATTGNHGQSIALAARAAGVRAVIVVPEGNNPEKNDAMRALGAEVTSAGRDFDTSRAHAQEIAAREGLRMIPPFHRDLVLGVATYARELFAAAQVDTVYVPIGMGSGICALITVRDLLGLDTEIVGVVAEGAPAMARSFEAGHIIKTDAIHTFAEGCACRQPDEQAFAIISRGCARVVTIPDDEIAEAMRMILRATHNLVEPAGAIALAALLREREAQRTRRVAFVLTGGNVDATTLASVLRPTPDDVAATPAGRSNR